MKGAIFIKTIVINKNDSGQRLDKFLNKTFENLPMSMLYKFLRTKRIKLNGKRAEIGVKLNEGDILNLYVKEEFLIQGNEEDYDFKNIKPDLSIIYEDMNIMLINKKVGVLVHADKLEAFNTLINQIYAYLWQKGEYNPELENSFAPALCNRIDRNTAGIVICAKNAESLRIINEKIKNNEIEKKYLALIHGVPTKKQAVLTAYHKKNADENIVKISDNYFNGAKIIRTKYNILQSKNNISLVEVALITGRTHQIRAHFAHINHPLVGDGKYSSREFYVQDKKAGFHSQALYSYKIKFKFIISIENPTSLDYLSGKEFGINISEINFAKNFIN